MRNSARLKQNARRYENAQQREFRSETPGARKRSAETPSRDRDTRPPTPWLRITLGSGVLRRPAEIETPDLRLRYKRKGSTGSGSSNGLDGSLPDQVLISLLRSAPFYTPERPPTRYSSDVVGAGGGGGGL